MNFPNVKGSMLSIVSKHRHLLSVEAESALLSASSWRYTFPIQGLPKETESVIRLGVALTCFEFNPKHGDILVVGTAEGDVFASTQSLVNHRCFCQQREMFLPAPSIWNWAKKFKMCHGAVNPVRCLRWTPDGLYLGVGFEKHVLQLLSFEVTVGFQIKIEIKAHTGSVNDIAYYTRNQSLYIVTCGEDGFVKIWNETNNQQPFITLKGHGTSVKSVSYSQFLFSTDISGMMKIWEVDDPGKEVDFNLQGCLIKNVLSNWRNGASCFFTSEEDKDFLPSITEWRIDDKSTSVTCKQRYKGVGKIPHRQFTFDTNGKILVVGNEQCLKFWDVDCDDCLWTTPPSDELQDARIIRLSRNGMFLAVLALDKSLKILGNLGGLNIAFANELTSGQPTMPTSSVPSFSIDRSTDVELRGHPQMVSSSIHYL
uniref:Uncharacterized protein n=1 Tax=Tanacetum cinerariifolium TaxID=118510 RepID=A0A6L2L171_TANCI|nr:hypothetical protein [Tanacetum cinerariifolium]